MLLISAGSFAQSINDYKYIIVPQRFDFQKTDNQYNINSLVKMMLEKYGFEVYFSNDDLPSEVAMNRCKALYAQADNDSGFMNTALIVSLKDCFGKVIFTSERGKSKAKDYKSAYHEALREVSRSFDVLGYRYSGNDANTAKAQDNPIAVKTPVNNDNLLTAKPVSNGYELIDKSGRTAIKMFRTSQPDYYSAQMEGVSGVVFKKDNDWFFEFYNNDELVSHKLNIKF